VSIFVYGDDTALSKPIEERVMFPMQVRRNLADALRHLRLVDTHRVLWVDAVCINQRNMVERSREVTRMGLIYHQARKVVAWLGMSTSGSGQALAALRNLANLVEISDDGWIFCSTNNKSNWRPRFDKPPLDDETCNELVALFSRPYFYRQWILQELRLASQHSLIQCGGDIVTLSELRRATEALSEARHVPLMLGRHMDWVAFSTSTHKIFVPLLGQSRARQCSDMLRDRNRNTDQLPLLEDLRTRWSDAIAQCRTPWETSLISPLTIDYLHGASLMELDNGYLGFGPSNVQPGDSLVVLLAAIIQWSCALRRTEPILSSGDVMYRV
jgi:hypothetical protein